MKLNMDKKKGMRPVARGAAGLSIYFADLNHPAHVPKAFPLGISCVAAYARQELGKAIDIKLFKLPADLQKAFAAKKPQVLCLSNYSWNLYLSYAFASAAKKRFPGLIVVFGGPNFPLNDQEQLDFLENFPAIDFYVFGEGEEGFVALLSELMAVGMQAGPIKKKKIKVQNCIYAAQGVLVRGDIQRIRGLDKIPSPYTGGLLDAFFDRPFIPLTETTRGCPFSCTYCSSGLDYQSRIERYSQKRVAETIKYIAGRARHCDELILADSNFGMYADDARTCRLIAGLQAKKGYPKTVKASAGKNKPGMISAMARVLGNSWHVGLAVQSTDRRVLAAIKREQILNEKILELADFGRQSSSFTYTEVILGLPNDSKQAHYDSLRFAIDGGFNSVRMYQLFLIRGTQVATGPSRRQYRMRTRWRIIPGCAGIYRFFGKKYYVGEPEEVVVSNATLSRRDYLDCRLMDCIVEIFFNNAWFEEVFALLRARNLPPFDLLFYFKSHPELYSEKMRSIFANFLEHDQRNLLGSRREIEAFLQRPGIIEKYLSSELGDNEILITKALCYNDFEETTKNFYNAARCFLKEKGMLTAGMTDYLQELERFCLMRKAGLLGKAGKTAGRRFKYDFKSIEKKNFAVDPQTLDASGGYLIEMYHDQSQRKMLRNCLNIYGPSLAGLAKLIQRVNFKEICRRYRQVRIRRKDKKNG